MEDAWIALHAFIITIFKVVYENMLLELKIATVVFLSFIFVCFVIMKEILNLNLFRWASIVINLLKRTSGNEFLRNILGRCLNHLNGGGM